MDFVPSDELAALKRRIGHPIVDADGHLVEFLPLVADLIRDVADPAVAARYLARVSDPVDRRVTTRGVRSAFWGLPAENTLDRATVMLPELMVARMDEIGLDYALLYPTLGLGALSIEDDELRTAAVRAFNTYYAQCYGPYRDRLAPVAVIPTFDPEEAVRELDHAVGVLGLRAVVLGGNVTRTTTTPEGESVRWIDTLADDSAHDYEPVWSRCEELGVVPSFHSSGMGFGTRASTTNYVYNHLGSFATGQEGICRALVMGGVPTRHPGLRFAFLEGGIAWACQLYADLVGHFSKRNKDSVGLYDPARLDLTRLHELFASYARGPMAARADRLEDDLFVRASSLHEDPARTDDFAESGITSVGDIQRIFTEQFFFGCEADDPLTALAFDRRVHPGGIRLNPTLASDVGHWDVPDVRGVLLEAWELVERGVLDDDDFRDFSFANVVRMLHGANPSFFDGTTVADAAARVA